MFQGTNLLTFFDDATLWERFGKWIILAVVLFLAVLFIILLYNGNKKLSTKSITYAAITIALSFVFSLLPPIFKLPQGGSIRMLVMLPLLLYAYTFGFSKGVLVCTIYGLLDMLLDPYIVHPIQAILDYPLAYAFLGFAGIFSKFKKRQILYFVLGIVIGLTGRYICHVLSGIIFFAEYADIVTYGTVLVYSLAYNSFVYVNGAMEIAAILILHFTNQLKYLIRYLRQASLYYDESYPNADAEVENKTE